MAVGPVRRVRISDPLWYDLATVALLVGSTPSLAPSRVYVGGFGQLTPAWLQGRRNLA